MRLLLLLLLIAAALGSSAIYLVGLDAGYVLFAWLGYTVEMTAWVFIATIVLVLMLVFIITILVRSILGVKFKLSYWFGSRSGGKIHTMTARGLAAFEEGHWARARKLLAKVADDSDNALVFYLLCARASHALGETSEVSDYLRKASNIAPAASMAVNLTQAQLQLKDGALEACLATLIRAHAINEAHPAVLKMLAKVYEGLSDWDSLQKLLPQLQTHSLVAKAELDILRARCSCELLMSASKKGLEDLSALWKKQSSSIQLRPDTVAVYTTCLISLKAFDKAAKLLEKTLNRELNDQLISIYGAIDGVDHQQRFSFVSGLLSAEKAPSAALLLCAGKLAVLNKLPGKAKLLLEQAFDKSATYEVCLALLDFYLDSGDVAKAQSILKKIGLLRP